MRPHHLVLTGALALASAAPAAGLALADDAPSAPPAPAAVSTVELPLLGVPLTVEVTTDAGGGVLDVMLTPPDDFLATQVDPGKVRFVNDALGTQVRIRGKHGRQTVEARAGALADISGPGSWSGDVFETGDSTSVAFTVSAAAAGGPDITGVSVTPANPDIEFAIGATEYETETDDDGEVEMKASVKVEFSYLGQTRTLKITAEVETGGDDDPSAKLKISLSKLDGRQTQNPDADGIYRWSGQLCNGDTGTIEYTVDGTSVVVGAVTPAADIDLDDHGAKIRFSDEERVTIKVTDDDGEIVVGASKKFRCDEVDPTVNTPISDEDDDSSDDDSSDDDDRSDDDRSDDDRSDDDSQGDDGSSDDD